MPQNNYEEDYLDADYEDQSFDEPQPRSGGKRNELVSYPTSVQDQQRREMEQFRRQSQNSMQAAATELAKSHADLFSLVVTAHLGKKEVFFEHKDSTVETTETKKYRMGIQVGSDITTKTTTKIVQRHHRLE